MPKLISWKVAWENERKDRKSIDKNKLCHFGVKPLDDAMPFIRNNELVVIGAESGVGKSELGLNIAITNAMSGKKVALFFLEGGEKEGMARLKHAMINEYLKTANERIKYADFISWKCNGIDGLDKVEEEVYKLAKEKIKDNLLIYEVDKGVRIDELIDSLTSCVKDDEWLNDENKPNIQLDLIIVDHLQYFELTKDENEIQQITKILRELKNITINNKIPVILISHFRKSDKTQGLPDQSSFYGSSNIPKISTTSIVISSDKTKEDFSDGLYPTWFRFVKSGIGLRDNYAIKINFNIKTNKYERFYHLHYVGKNSFPVDKMITQNSLPTWAKNNILNVKKMYEVKKESIDNINWDN
jgi:hypothetical protein